jgi:hypothetical protein
MSKPKLVLRSTYISHSLPSPPPPSPEIIKRNRGRPKGSLMSHEREEQKEKIMDIIGQINQLSAQLMNLKKDICGITPKVKGQQEKAGRPKKYKTMDEIRQKWRENYYTKKAKKIDGDQISEKI